MNAIPECRNDELTPREVLKLLEEGNDRFISGQLMQPNRDFERLRQVAPRQKPMAAILGCADSRVPVEIIFDRGFGDLVVTRIAGNVTTPEILGSLEFAVHALGAKVLYILGHTNCGAVAAAIQGEETPGQISALFQHLRQAVKAGNGDPRETVIENVRNQALLVSEASPLIARRIREGNLLVAGGVYDLETGKVNAVAL